MSATVAKRFKATATTTINNDDDNIRHTADFESKLLRLRTTFPLMNPGLLASFLRTARSNYLDAETLAVEVHRAEALSQQFLQPKNEKRGHLKRDRMSDDECSTVKDHLLDKQAVSLLSKVILKQRDELVRLRYENQQLNKQVSELQAEVRQSRALSKVQSTRTPSTFFHDGFNPLRRLPDVF